MQLQPNTNADKDAAVLRRGSRDWIDEDAVRAQLERAVARFGAERLVVIAGGARGADRQAEACARELGLAVELYPARWDRHGRSAGYRRNVQMLDRLADFPHRYVIAFSIASRGTRTRSTRRVSAAFPPGLSAAKLDHADAIGEDSPQHA